jgi:inhibitor of KinA
MLPSFQRVSDHAFLISFGNDASFEMHQKVHALLNAVLHSTPDFITNIHPAYCSILFSFDPLQATFDEVEAYVQGVLKASSGHPTPSPRQIEIPVCYDDEFAPDLDAVASHNNLSREQVVDLHASGSYYACFIGFTPGFAYLGGMSPRLATPRLPSPRTRVPAGSVAIGGGQTAVYPISTPGGWRLIGRTPLKLFSPEKEPFSLLALGDRVRFRKITREEFGRLQKAFV